MKFQNKSILVVGVFIILSFAVVAYLIGEKMTQTARRMSNEMAVSFGQNSYLIVKNELEASIEKVEALQRSIQRVRSFQQEDNEVVMSVLKSGLNSNKELVSSWVVLTKSDQKLKQDGIGCRMYCRKEGKGILACDTLSDRYEELYGEVIRQGRELISDPYRDKSGELLISILTPLRDGEKIDGVVGVDLDLYRFQEHFFDAEALGKAYVMIVSPQDYCITHPDEKQIGNKITTFRDAGLMRELIVKGQKQIREVHSEYLNLPVLRIYQPISLGTTSGKWLIAVSVPLFNVRESAHEIRNSVALIGLISAFLLMLFLYFSQNRWKYEFLKRQKAESGQKEVMSKLSSILEGSDQIMIFSVDWEGKYTSFNSVHKKEMKDREGIRIVVGQNFLEAFQDEFADRMGGYLERVLQGEHFLAEYKRKGIHYQQIFNTILDDKGEVVGASSIRINISETVELRHRAQKEKEERVEAQLKNLKNQINPHFLFNSLNSLYALVEEEPTLARQFIVKLSKVYRYFLDSNQSNLVFLKDEMELIRHYLFLQRIRFGENLSIENEIPESILKQKIPSAGLQSLVENAIKHNVITKAQPLRIRLFVQGDFLVVENPYQPRPDVVPTSGTGLKNLEALYRYLGDQIPIYGIVEGTFSVKLPLL